MSFLRELYERWKERRAEAAREFDEMDDDATTDKYLRSLRRWKRRQNEEIEKQRLIQEIRKYEFDRTQKDLWGVRHDKSKRIKLSKKALSTSYNLNGINPILKRGKIKL